MNSKILDWLYQNWARLCIFIAVYLLWILFMFRPQINFWQFLIWLQVPLYMLHQFEEHAFPGGFKNFVNREVFKIRDRELPLDDRSIFWINIPVVWILMPLFATLTIIDIKFGIWIAYFSIFNAATHIIALIIKRKYNPGALVSLLVNLPVSIYTLAVLARANVITAAVNISAITITILLHLLIVAYAVTTLKRAVIKT